MVSKKQVCKREISWTFQGIFYGKKQSRRADTKYGVCAREGHKYEI